jgi:hypothetical protein
MINGTITTPEALRPTDIAWAQNLIIDLQRDEALRARWQQAEAAFCYTEANGAEPSPERSHLLNQLIHIGQALDEDTQRLQQVQQHSHLAPGTDPTELAEIARIRSQIFITDAA